MTTLAEYRSSRELLTNLTLRELRAKYKRSLLGWSWSLLNPLATVIIYSLAVLAGVGFARYRRSGRSPVRRQPGSAHPGRPPARPPSSTGSPSSARTPTAWPTRSD